MEFKKIFKTNLLSIILIIFYYLFNHVNLYAKLYKIDLTTPEKTIQSNHLKMGGEDFKGEKISVNNYYMSINDKPVIPVTGEFHYTRYPNKYWDESLRKMKAGGVNTIASYVFWNIHEEIEGVFDWKGDKNLRKFIELCAKNDIRVIVRIGPFCHGEIRNGGLPDWLLGRSVITRSNDPGYLRYVERLFVEISKQIEGLLFKDGGPIFAVQLENEFQHSASPWGLTYPDQPHDFTSAEPDREFTMAGVGSAEKKNPYAHLGNEHMKILKALAQKAGIEVPIYTATGWGYAAIVENETIPVTAAYPYPTWASQKLSPFFIFKELQKEPDYTPIRYHAEDYPYFAAEIGGGIMVLYKRRPIIPAKSLDALINRFIGGGTNGIGYYMYHGGSSPRGKNGFLSDEAYGYPKISYDFQAPLGEYGQPNQSFKRLKLIHYFLNKFGGKLAPMSVVIPEQSNKTPENIETLRYAVRKSGDSGFICMLNFQDHLKTEDIHNIQFLLKSQQGEMRIPESSSFTLKSGENAIFPFNFDLSGINLNYATAQLLTKLENEKDHIYIFFSIDGIEPEVSIKTKSDFTFETKNCEIIKNPDHILAQFSTDHTGLLTINSRIKILMITRKKALQAWKAVITGNDYVIFSDAIILQNKNLFEAIICEKNLIECEIYPKLYTKPTTNIGVIKDISTDESIFSHYKISLPKIEIEPKITKITENKLSILLPKKDNNLNDIMLNIDYIGDTGMAFLNGRLVADHFYFGEEWRIGLKRFFDSAAADEMILYFRPLYKDAPFYQDFAPEIIPDFKKSNRIFKINNIKFIPEYKVIVQFNE